MEISHTNQFKSIEPRPVVKLTYTIRETQSNGHICYVNQIVTGSLGVNGTSRQVFRGHSTVASIDDARAYATADEATKKMRILQKFVKGSLFELVSK